MSDSLSPGSISVVKGVGSGWGGEEETQDFDSKIDRGGCFEDFVASGLFHSRAVSMSMPAAVDPGLDHLGPNTQNFVSDFRCVKNKYFQLKGAT